MNKKGGFLYENFKLTEIPSGLKYLEIKKDNIIFTETFLKKFKDLYQKIKKNTVKLEDLEVVENVEEDIKKVFNMIDSNYSEKQIKSNISKYKNNIYNIYHENNSIIYKNSDNNNNAIIQDDFQTKIINRYEIPEIINIVDSVYNIKSGNNYIPYNPIKDSYDMIKYYNNLVLISKCNSLYLYFNHDNNKYIIYSDGIIIHQFSLPVTIERENIALLDVYVFYIENDTLYFKDINIKKKRKKKKTKGNDMSLNTHTIYGTAISLEYNNIINLKNIKGESLKNIKIKNFNNVLIILGDYNTITVDENSSKKIYYLINNKKKFKVEDFEQNFFIIEKVTIENNGLKIKLKDNREEHFVVDIVNNSYGKHFSLVNRKIITPINNLTNVKLFLNNKKMIPNKYIEFTNFYFLKYPKFDIMNQFDFLFLSKNNIFNKIHFNLKEKSYLDIDKMFSEESIKKLEELKIKSIKMKSLFDSFFLSQSEIKKSYLGILLKTILMNYGVDLYNYFNNDISYFNNDKDITYLSTRLNYLEQFSLKNTLTNEKLLEGAKDKDRKKKLKKLSNYLTTNKSCINTHNCKPYLNYINSITELKKIFDLMKPLYKKLIKLYILDYTFKFCFLEFNTVTGSIFYNKLLNLEKLFDIRTQCTTIHKNEYVVMLKKFVGNLSNSNLSYRNPDFNPIAFCSAKRIVNDLVDVSFANCHETLINNFVNYFEINLESKGINQDNFDLMISNLKYNSEYIVYYKQETNGFKYEIAANIYNFINVIIYLLDLNNVIDYFNIDMIKQSYIEFKNTAFNFEEINKRIDVIKKHLEISEEESLKCYIEDTVKVVLTVNDMKFIWEPKHASVEKISDMRQLIYIYNQLANSKISEVFLNYVEDKQSQDLVNLIINHI